MHYSAVPGPAGLPVLGSILSFSRDPLVFMSNAAAAHGDRVAFRLGGYPLLQLNHPDDVESVLLKNAKSMHKDAIYEYLRPLLGNGLVTSEGETWKRHRKLAAPSFSKKHVALYADAMVDETARYLDGIGQDAHVDVHHDMMELAQAIVFRTLFGDLEADVEGVGHAIEVVMEEFVPEAQGHRRLLPGWIPTPGRRRADRAVAQIDRLMTEVIAARRREGLGDDLLSRLIEARGEDGEAFDDQALRDEAITLFVAGHETTALTLTYTMGLLAQHPEVQTALEAEVDAVLGDRGATAADMGRLPYTTAVIRESMRLLPPVWAIGREAIDDVVIGDIEVPRGTQLLIPIWVLHRDPRWFDDPETFEPARWLDGLDKRLPRMAYMPFGGGPRVCIGNHFAMLEAVMVLATMAQRLRIEVTDAFPPTMLPSITLRPTGPVSGRARLRERR